MNEDEAFIREIVDQPDDELARLVYADWLDERDDPRGSYLRAECEAVETGNVERLRERASRLDPVWVARVSLPPVGVCCDGFAWSKRGRSVGVADVDRFERRFGVRLPVQYRAFLLNDNGAPSNSTRGRRRTAPRTAAGATSIRSPGLTATTRRAV